MTSSTCKRAAISIVTLFCLSGVAVAGRGGFGGFRGGGFSGFRGGSYGGFHGSYGGGFEGSRGGYGTSSFNRAPSFDTSRSYGGYSGMRGTEGRNPYGGAYGAGARTGSFTTPGGSTVKYGAAGAGGVGPGGTAAGRGVGAVNVTTPGGRSVTDVGRAGGAVGPEGNAIAGRSNVAVASGPRGTAVAGSRGGVVAGAGGAVAGRSYGGAAWGWHNPAYASYHSGWVHGYWNGHYNGWGWGWGGYGAGLATGAGLAMWGMGSALYSGWGYMPYMNPYYTAPAVVVQPPVYDYSQPINTTSAAPDAAVTDPALTAFDQARDAFKAGNYENALTLADQALKAMPDDTTIHEFRGLDLFALQRYDEAAAVLYGVLSVGPGWDWTTLISLYPDVDVFTAQQRAARAVHPLESG